MVFIQDVNALPSSVTFTDEGYLTATAKVARTGIQKYRGFELGKKDDKKEYAIYRPEQEVKDSIATIPNKPITIDHRGMVNIKNNSQLSRGFMSDAVYEEDGWVSVDLCINHPEGIQAFNDGYRWHSLGYNAEIEWRDGTTPEGEAYDAIMKNIRVNHDALVKSPRAGELATFDSEDINIGASKNVINIKQESKGVPTRMTKKYEVRLLDSAVIELEGDHASEIHSLIANLESKNKQNEVKVSDSESALDKAQKEIVDLIAARDALQGKIDALEAPVISDSVEVETAKERAEWVQVFDSVRSLIKEPTYLETVKDLKVVAIKSVNDSLDLSDKSDDYINAVFDVYRPQLGKQSANVRLSAKDILDQSTPDDIETSIKSAEADYLKATQDAWRL